MRHKTKIRGNPSFSADSSTLFFFSLNFKTDAAENNTPIEDIPPHLDLKSSIMEDGAEQDIETATEEL